MSHGCHEFREPGASARALARCAKRQPSKTRASRLYCEAHIKMRVSPSLITPKLFTVYITFCCWKRPKNSIKSMWQPIPGNARSVPGWKKHSSSFQPVLNAPVTTDLGQAGTLENEKRHLQLLLCTDVKLPRCCLQRVGQCAAAWTWCSKTSGSAAHAALWAPDQFFASHVTSTRQP